MPMLLQMLKEERIIVSTATMLDIDKILVNIDSVFHEDAEDPLIVSIAAQPASGAVRLDNPDTDSDSAPYCGFGQTTVQNHGKDIAVCLHAVNQLLQRVLKPGQLFVVAFGFHGPEV